MKKALIYLLLFVYTLDASPLQDAIDKASPYSTINLKSGIYIGNIVINKPLRIVGQKGVVLDAKGLGDVITINSSDVCLRNLVIKNSGTQMHLLESAIKINKASNIRISDCKIKNSLYGINMYMVKDSTFSHNYISSIKENLELRGNGLKIWLSNNNIFNDNTIEKVRDNTLNYSNKNIFKNNTFLKSRFSLHLSLSHKNIIENNDFNYNSVSIMIMGAKDTNITNNKILSSNGAAGIGTLFKGVHNLHFNKNQVSFNAVGIYVDSKSTELNMQRYFTNNIISYNKEAMHFHKDIQNNTIVNNIFEGNINDIVKNTQQNTTFDNDVRHNYWDRYAGFDSDKNNIGDRSFKMYIYADQLWQYDHRLKFFYASPMMSILNFISELTPVIEPVLILEDKEPLMFKKAL